MPSTVFLEKPRTLFVDEDYSIKSPRYETIEELMHSLQTVGPLLVSGRMGPSAYPEAPIKLKNSEIYGFQPHTIKSYAPRTEAILLGAKLIDSSAYVYYTLADDTTPNHRSPIRGYQPSDTDTKIYAMAYDDFLQRALRDVPPICPHAQRLYTHTLQDEELKQIGQQIFDHYKAIDHGDWEAGKYALERICEAAKALKVDGAALKERMERVWDGIGDTEWRWKFEPQGA